MQPVATEDDHISATEWHRPASIDLDARVVADAARDRVPTLAQQRFFATQKAGPHLLVDPRMILGQALYASLSEQVRTAVADVRPTQGAFADDRGHERARRALRLGHAGATLPDSVVGGAKARREDIDRSHSRSFSESALDLAFKNVDRRLTRPFATLVAAHSICDRQKISRRLAHRPRIDGVLVMVALPARIGSGAIHRSKVRTQDVDRT